MKIIFMGTPLAAVPSLERLVSDGHDIAAVYTQPDRPWGRGNKITFSPVKESALAHGFDLIQPLKIKTDEALETFRSHAADIAVVVAYGRILPPEFLTAFPNGAVNVHFSLLPKYRGAAPVNWAIVNGETETGVTTMKMDAGLDTGDILMQRSTLISEDETAIELISRLSDIGADLLSETMGGLGQVKPNPQNHALATLAPIMKREDGLIDWRLSAQEISNRVRGFQPFPSSFTYLGGHKLIVWKASPFNESEPVKPGVIWDIHVDRFFVGCGNNSSLEINEIQPEGKRRMAVRDFLNGARIKTGDVLGES